MVGQCLYIPIGWRHKAEPQGGSGGCAGGDGRPSGGGGGGGGGDGGPSVHLTMGVQLPRWVDGLEALTHTMGASLCAARQS